MNIVEFPFFGNYFCFLASNEYTPQKTANIILKFKEKYDPSEPNSTIFFESLEDMNQILNPYDFKFDKILIHYYLEAVYYNFKKVDEFQKYLIENRFTLRRKYFESLNTLIEIGKELKISSFGEIVEEIINYNSENYDENWERKKQKKLFQNYYKNLEINNPDVYTVIDKIIFDFHFEQNSIMIAITTRDYYKDQYKNISKKIQLIENEILFSEFNFDDLSENLTIKVKKGANNITIQNSINTVHFIRKDIENQVNEIIKEYQHIFKIKQNEIEDISINEFEINDGHSQINENRTNRLRYLLKFLNESKRNYEEKKYVSMHNTSVLIHNILSNFNLSNLALNFLSVEILQFLKVPFNNKTDPDYWLPKQFKKPTDFARERAKELKIKKDRWVNFKQ